MQSTKTAIMRMATPPAAAAMPAMKAVLPVSASTGLALDAWAAPMTTLGRGDTEGDPLVDCEGVVVAAGEPESDVEGVTELVLERVDVNEVVGERVELGVIVEERVELGVIVVDGVRD